jgi:hypothetical protein
VAASQAMKTLLNGTFGSGAGLKIEILYYMGISSVALTITAPLQVDHKDFNSTFS